MKIVNDGESFKYCREIGTASGKLYLNLDKITEGSTGDGKINNNEIKAAFERAEDKFSNEPTLNKAIVDGFWFHTEEHNGYKIYCLPFGYVYYEELDHE